MTTSDSEGRPCFLVTGAASGIGRACALKLDAMGYVVFAGTRSEEARRDLQSSASPALLAIELDITRDDHLRRAVEIVKARGGNLAGVVNNAGIYVSGPLEILDRSALQRQLEVNVTSQIAVAIAFLPLLRQSAGRMVFVGSTSAHVSEPLSGPYCASKSALDTIVSALRREIRPSGVSVSIIEPGAIATRLWDKVIEAETALANSLSKQDRRRYGDAIERRREKFQRIRNTARPPDRVCASIVHALTAAHPKARYVVGRDARLRRILAWLLPQAAWEKASAVKSRIAAQRARIGRI